jgi:hypothetical protein
MKLRMLAVVVVGCLGLPAMAQAQGDTTTKAMPKDTTMKDTTAKRTPRSRARRARMQAGDTTATRMATSTGTDCPMKCPTSKGAAGLTGVQFLALQQELRDRGCGNAHVTGWLDAPTRRAIAKCAKELNVANKAAAVLAAMNIGYTAAELGASEAPKG